MSRQIVQSRIVIPLIIHPLSRFSLEEAHLLAFRIKQKRLTRILDANDMILLICPTAYEYYDIPS